MEKTETEHHRDKKKTRTRRAPLCRCTPHSTAQHSTAQHSKLAAEEGREREARKRERDNHTHISTPASSPHTHTHTPHTHTTTTHTSLAFPPHSPTLPYKTHTPRRLPALPADRAPIRVHARLCPHRRTERTAQQQAPVGGSSSQRRRDPTRRRLWQHLSTAPACPRCQCPAPARRGGGIERKKERKKERQERHEDGEQVSLGGVHAGAGQKENTSTHTCVCACKKEKKANLR